MSSALTSDGKAKLRQASREPIGSYFQGLSSLDRQAKWIHGNNRYRVRCTSRYENDLKATPPTVDDSDLVSYIAASGPCHVIDGWSFIGRAIDSMLRGDTYGAIHLGYYAELRAAMALLACEGVGIFNQRHVTVDRSSKTHLFSKSGTHKVIWPCLQHWAGLAKSSTLLDSTFRPANRGLSAWLTALRATVPARAIANHWLRSWGIDLVNYDADHNSRNLVSYRPYEFRRSAAHDTKEISDFVEDLWMCFEPSEGNRFPVIERYLLRRALVAGRVTFPLSDVSLASVGMSVGEVASWLPVLNGTTEPTFFAEAELQSAIEDSKCHLQVIARAALLLYLATSAARRHFAAAGYTREDLAFWWGPHGISRGLWDGVNQPANPLDLWADILEILRENQEFLAGKAGTLSLNSWRRGQSRAIEFMGAYELIAIWGLLP